MKKTTIIILAALLILSLIGCAGTDKTAAPDVSTSDADKKVEGPAADTDKDGVNDAKQNKEAAQSYDNVPGTNVPIYPDSEQVHEYYGSLIYATTDSGEAVNNFYKNYLDIKERKRSGSSHEGYYYHETPLTKLARAYMSDESQENKDELNAYIKKFGGLQTVSIFDAGMESEAKDYIVPDSVLEEVSDDKTLILYGIMEEK